MNRDDIPAAVLEALCAYKVTRDAFELRDPQIKNEGIYDAMHKAHTRLILEIRKPWPAGTLERIALGQMVIGETEPVRQTPIYRINREMGEFSVELVRSTHKWMSDQILPLPEPMLRPDVPQTSPNAPSETSGEPEPDPGASR
jgi:hypothetical protein